jgi:hypothetical protein
MREETNGRNKKPRWEKRFGSEKVSGQKDLKGRKESIGDSALLVKPCPRPKKEGQAEAPLMTLKRTKWGLEEGKFHQTLTTPVYCRQLNS